MSRYYIQFSGRERDTVGVECADTDQARDTAIKQLGAYLSDHPDYAVDGNWRVTIEDETRRPRLTVIVAAVPARD